VLVSGPDAPKNKSNFRAGRLLGTGRDARNEHRRKAMTPFNSDSTEQQHCNTKMQRFAGNAFLLLLGGGIGAILALIFAPKPGKELREDIAAEAARRYNETIDAAHTLRLRTGEYLDVAKDTGKKVLDVASSRMSTVREEVGEDIETIGEIFGASAARMSERSSQDPPSLSTEH
jgi:gas vesicle protein